jgi:hypothetical protein
VGIRWLNTPFNSRLSAPTILGSPGKRIAVFGGPYSFIILDVLTGRTLLKNYISSVAVNAPTIINHIILQPVLTPGGLFAFGLPT